jgi:hypothetical protein
MNFVFIIDELFTGEMHPGGGLDSKIFEIIIEYKSLHLNRFHFLKR